MSPKVLSKYHKKGISTITQLSHLFRPRRRRGRPYKTSVFLWELKSLAIREQKTFVLHPPDLKQSSEIIYLDFEGIPEEHWVYLIGGILKQEGKPDEVFSFWADNKENENEIFRKLFSFFREHPDALVYHYGGYETKVLNRVSKKYKGIFRQELPPLEKRMINLLSYLRTHVYPPTYTNGLKELGNFLDFHWSDEEADGLRSIYWRKKWEDTKENIWKEKLLLYNQEDCKALENVHQWFNRLTSDSEKENVQQVSMMKKQSPFKFQDNPHYGEDYISISRAAYFDYQRKKIYWRGQERTSPLSNLKKLSLLKHSHKGVATWKPKKVNQVIIAPPLKKCPRCGHKKIYQIRTRVGTARQTDLKFTSTGIKQWVIEYRAATARCAKCKMNLRNGPLRMVHYGDNLFAWAINLYIKYNISHEMIARMLKEQFGIWMNPTYLIERKRKWCSKWKPEVDYIRQIILKSPVIHIDETNVRLSKDKGYVWVFATPHTVLYHFSISHEVDFLKEWLKGYKGVVVTDFFPTYETLPVRRQKCLIHLIRDLNDDLYKTPFDEEYKALVSAFGKLLRNIITTIDRYGLKEIHLRKHLKDAQKFYKEFIESTHTSELSVKYAKRLKKHWEELWTFLYHDNIPWNNNNAETAVKAFAQYRRGVNGQVSERGIREYLEMLSIAQTCRYRNVSFLNFVRGKVGLWENVNPEVLPGFLPFGQARLFIQKFGFQRKQEWNQWKKEKRPAFIPSSPERTYFDKGWIDWHDWLGFSFLPFPEARTYMRRLGLKNRDEYWAWCRSGKRPKTIPSCPEKIYKHTGWKDLGDWLGTGNTGQQRKPRMSYEQAKRYIQAVGIKTQHEFFQWRKTKERPVTMPPDPNKTYLEFKNWGEFLGTGRIANQNKKYRSYDEAKIFFKTLRIRSIKHFRQLCKMNVIPSDIPRSPYAYYRKQKTWVSVSDFFSK